MALRLDAQLGAASCEGLSLNRQQLEHSQAALGLQSCIGELLPNRALSARRSQHQTVRLVSNYFQIVNGGNARVTNPSASSLVAIKDKKRQAGLDRGARRSAS